MAGIKIEMELRCNTCDNVLVVGRLFTDENGAYCYVEPCEECERRRTMRAVDLPCTCAKFENGTKVFPMRECDGCRKSASH